MVRAQVAEALLVGRQHEEKRSPMSAAKTTSERVDKLRKDRAALGRKRKEVYVHDDDWPELLKLAKRLERRRTKLLASGAG